MYLYIIQFVHTQINFTASAPLNVMKVSHLAPPSVFHGHNFIEVRNATEAAGLGYVYCNRAKPGNQTSFRLDPTAPILVEP